MTLGEPGVAGNDENHFRSPAGVVTAPNGDIFVADGHGSNNRIVKYSKDGKFIKAWGKTGYAPGEFRVAHCIAMDKRGRLFVCDRSNARIQIFDQDGKYLARWHQFGMPSGIAFSVNDEDLIYVFDSESDNVDNPGFEQGIRIGDALNGWVQLLHPGSGRPPGHENGKRAGVRHRRQIRQHVRGRAAAARSAEIRQGQVVMAALRGRLFSLHDEKQIVGDRGDDLHPIAVGDAVRVHQDEHAGLRRRAARIGTRQERDIAVEPFELAVLPDRGHPVVLSRMMNQPNPSWSPSWSLTVVAGDCSAGSSGESTLFCVIPMLNKSHCHMSFGDATIPPAPK